MIKEYVEWFVESVLVEEFIEEETFTQWVVQKYSTIPRVNITCNIATPQQMSFDI